MLRAYFTTFWATNGIIKPPQSFNIKNAITQKASRYQILYCSPYLLRSAMLILYDIYLLTFNAFNYKNSRMKKVYFIKNALKDCALTRNDYETCNF